MAELDLEKLDALTGKVVGNASAALSGLLAYIGDQTGVYQAMADGESRTADQIAAIANATTVVWAAVVYLALVMTALGYAIWYHLLGKYDVNQILPFLLLLPVITVLGSVILLDETLTPQLTIGGLISIIGVTIINVARNPFRRRAQGVLPTKSSTHN